MSALIAASAFFLLRTLFPSLTALTHSYPGYYLASRLVLEQRWTPQVYDNAWFEARVLELTDGRISERFSLHPPTTSLLLVPIAWLDMTIARVVWQLFNFALLLLGLWLTVKALPLPSFAGRALFLTFVCLYPPLAENFRVGQTYVLVWFCFALALWSEMRSKPIGIGVGLGIAAALKLSGIPIVLLLATRKQWRALGWTVLIVALLSLLGLLVLGNEGWFAFIQRVLASVQSVPSAAHAAYQTTPSFFQKLFVASPDFNPTPLFDAPALAPLINLAVTGAALGLTLWFGHRGAFETAFAAAVTLSVILFPQALEYHYTLLLLPLAVMFAKLSATRTRGDVVWFTVILILLYVPLDWNAPRWNERTYVLLAYPRLYGGWLLWLWLLKQMSVRQLVVRAASLLVATR